MSTCWPHKQVLEATGLDPGSSLTTLNQAWQSLGWSHRDSIQVPWWPWIKPGKVWVGVTGTRSRFLPDDPESSLAKSRLESPGLDPGSLMTLDQAWQSLGWGHWDSIQVPLWWPWIKPGNVWVGVTETRSRFLATDPQSSPNTWYV